MGKLYRIEDNMYYLCGDNYCRYLCCSNLLHLLELGELTGLASSELGAGIKPPIAVAVYAECVLREREKERERTALDWDRVSGHKAEPVGGYPSLRIDIFE